MSITGLDALKIFDTTNGSEEPTPLNQHQGAKFINTQLSAQNRNSIPELYANSSTEMI